MVTLGLMTGFFTAYGTANIDSSISWRTPFIILASLAMMYAVAAHLWLPPSPRWLMLRGRQSEVAAAWDALDVGLAELEKAEVVQEIIEDAHNPAPSVVTTHPRDDEPSSIDVSITKKRHALLDVFAPDVRSRTILGVFLLGMQQMSGIDGVLYVSHPLFTEILL